ncbi:MAG: amidohydrolase family protein [Streptosporangiaceae bacterium]
MSDATATVLVRNAEVHGCSGADVRVGPDRIEGVGPGLTRLAGERVVDGAGGAVIPGLHDHHVHLRAVVAARRSVDASSATDPRAFDQLISSAASAATTGWLRVTGWDEDRGGALDRRRLDRLARALPARVQHRSGAMWVLNSAALSAVGAEHCDLAGIERDQDGLPTGRLLRMDGWLRSRLAATGNGEDRHAFRNGLAAYATWCARLGVTGFTDATPDRDQADADEFAALSDAGDFPQRLLLMAPPGLDPPGADTAPSHGRVLLGPTKVILDDAALPSEAELASRFAAAHGRGRGAAVHCVTAEQLVVAVAAFERAGPAPAATADRIEHAGIVPPGYAAHLARLGLAVVTQPGFIQDRGDDYLLRVPEAERGWLYPCASLLRAGVPVAAGTDAPFGPPDPWLAIAAATSRRTASGATVGAAERVSAARALRLFLAAPGDVRQVRRIAAGQPGDVCILRTPMSKARADPADTQVLATVIGGRVFSTD